MNQVCWKKSCNSLILVENWSKMCLECRDTEGDDRWNSNLWFDAPVQVVRLVWVWMNKRFENVRVGQKCRWDPRWSRSQWKLCGSNQVWLGIRNGLSDFTIIKFLQVNSYFDDFRNFESVRTVLLSWARFVLQSIADSLVRVEPHSLVD
jgi:hypothetical protein